MRTLNLLILVLSFLLFTAAGAYSQGDTTRANQKEKLKKIVKEKLIEKLNIDDASATKLIDLTSANKKELKEMMKKRMELTDYIFENPQSSDVGSKLEELLDNENKMNQAKNDYYTKLKSFLTPNQIAQSMVFQKELIKFMKKEIKKEHGDDKRGKDRDGKDKSGRDKDHGPGEGNRELF